jgi:hypothetical protein
MRVAGPFYGALDALNLPWRLKDIVDYNFFSDRKGLIGFKKGTCDIDIQYEAKEWFFVNIVNCRY